MWWACQIGEKKHTETRFNTRLKRGSQEFVSLEVEQARAEEQSDESRKGTQIGYHDLAARISTRRTADSLITSGGHAAWLFFTSSALRCIFSTVSPLSSAKLKRRVIPLIKVVNRRVLSSSCHGFILVIFPCLDITASWLQLHHEATLVRQHLYAS